MRGRRLYNRQLTGLPQFIRMAPLNRTRKTCTTSLGGRIFRCMYECRETHVTGKGENHEEA